MCEIWAIHYATAGNIEENMESTKCYKFKELLEKKVIGKVRI